MKRNPFSVCVGFALTAFGCGTGHGGAALSKDDASTDVTLVVDALDETDAGVVCSLETGCPASAGDRPGCVRISAYGINEALCCSEAKKREYCVRAIGADKLLTCYVLEPGIVAIFGDDYADQLGFARCTPTQYAHARTCEVAACPAPDAGGEADSGD